MLKLHQSHFIIDGEAVVLGPDGVSDFAALNKYREQAQLYAFDNRMMAIASKIVCGCQQ